MTSRLAYPLLRCNPSDKEKPDRNVTSSDLQSTSLFHLDSISGCEKATQTTSTVLDQNIFQLMI